MNTMEETKNSAIKLLEGQIESYNSIIKILSHKEGEVNEDFVRYSVATAACIYNYTQNMLIQDIHDILRKTPSETINE